MKRIIPFAAAFLLLAAVVAGILFIKLFDIKKDTTFDGAKFVAESIGIIEKAEKEPHGGGVIPAVRFRSGGKLI